MKIKFNLFERVAGLFVLTAMGSAVALTIGMGIKKGWFEPKMKLKTYVKAADGIRSGTPVNFSGLQIGSVDSVDLKAGQGVEIQFRVRKRFAKQLHDDAVIRVVRPFIIGEKVLEIDTSEASGPLVKEGQTLMAQQAPDFLEFLGGNKLGNYMESLSSTMENLQKLAEAFLSNERSDKIIELFDEIFPLMEKMNSMASEVSTLSATLTEKKKMAKTIDQFLVLSRQMNKTLPMMSKDMPELSQNVLVLTKNLNQLTKDMNQIIPVIKEIAPDIPMTTQKAVKALDETVVTLKAMQKTFFLRSSVREVKEEQQAEQKKEENRQPAGNNF
ncbi:MAG: MCE family protein [Bdellovibrionales bacterium]|nr:MlaD family protein [Bdellovibrionales bacterium]NQZ19070.1 MCE family protein [Bdellovibrionales bacterium]